MPPNPEIPEDYPDYYYNSNYVRYFKTVPRTGPFPTETIRKMRHGYAACVSYVDVQIGKVLAELDHLKLRNNTIVILWGDHGYLCYDHGIWGKHNTFERAVRSPLIIRTPGMKGGMSTASLTEFVDIYPTLCELAGLPIPEHTEGLSLRPVLENPERSVKDAAFSQYPAKGTMGYSIRTERYRFTEWQNRQTGRIEAQAFFDYVSDPDETENRIDHPEYTRVIQKLKTLLNERN
jgi:arylsulfatase A-like enzyme